MSDDVRRKLQARLGGPTGVRAALEDKLGQGPGKSTRTEETLYAPVDVYFVADGTGSMQPMVDAVSAGMTAIGTELFKTPGKGEMRMGVWVVRDHKDPAYFTQGTLRNSLTALVQDIRAIRCDGGDDLPEAYECAWRDLARTIPQLSGTRKSVVVFAGDAIPHGYAQPSQGPRRMEVYDNGCPEGVDYRMSWQAMTTAATLTLFVGTYESTSTAREMIAAQRSIVDEKNPNQKYILSDRMGDIPAIILAGARLAQSPHAAQEYIERLKIIDSGKAARVRGYLGMDK